MAESALPEVGEAAKPVPGSRFPLSSLPKVGGDTLSLVPTEGRWKVVVVFRGLFCPLCTLFLPKLEQVLDEYTTAGLDLVAISADNSADAHEMYAKAGLTKLPVGYDLSVTDMYKLGVYISDRVFHTESNNTKPFAEPAVFVVNTAGNIQIVDISNSPGIRFDPAVLLLATTFARDNNYPIRGLHASPLSNSFPKPVPGTPFPVTSLPKVGGGTLSLLPEQGRWKAIIVYRGIFCPLCTMYLPKIEQALESYQSGGVDLVAISADNATDANAMYSNLGLTKLSVGYDLTVADMYKLGVYISDRVFHTETGNTKPFAEPAVFVVNSDGNIQIVDISNSPGIRPDPGILLLATTFARDNNYPIRGLHSPSVEQANLQVMATSLSKPVPGSPFPVASLPKVGGGTLSLLPEGGRWKTIIVYRGIFCPLCALYLPKVELAIDDYNAGGLDLVAISADNSADAHEMYSKLGLTKLAVGYDLSVADMYKLRVYISDRVFHTETGNTKPFAEPAIFVVNAEGNIHIVDVSNSPGIRPDLGVLLLAATFARDNNYPIRGRHEAPVEADMDAHEAVTGHEQPPNVNIFSKLRRRLSRGFGRASAH